MFWARPSKGTRHLHQSHGRLTSACMPIGSCSMCDDTNWRPSGKCTAYVLISHDAAPVGMCQMVCFVGSAGQRAGRRRLQGEDVQDIRRSPSPAGTDDCKAEQSIGDGVQCCAPILPGVPWSIPGFGWGVCFCSSTCHAPLATLRWRASSLHSTSSISSVGTTFEGICTCPILHVKSAS